MSWANNKLHMYMTQTETLDMPLVMPWSSSRQLQVSYITASLAETRCLAQGHFRGTDASMLLYSLPAAKPPANSRLLTLAVG